MNPYKIVFRTDGGAAFYFADLSKPLTVRACVQEEVRAWAARQGIFTAG